MALRWRLAHHANPAAAHLADRHYSRRTVGSHQMMPPGRKLVLITEDGLAVWGTSWPYAELSRHAYPGAWLCTIFRNEGPHLSSELIREAVAATRYHFGDPPDFGMITWIAPKKIRSANPGFCFKKAGFKRIGMTTRGLVVLQLLPEDMPEAEPYSGRQLRLFS